MRLRQGTAVVASGGSGIGRAIAGLFANEGASVVANDTSRERASKTARSMNAADVEALATAAHILDS